jgi:hypothetical protein
MSTSAVDPCQRTVGKATPQAVTLPAALAQEPRCGGILPIDMIRLVGQAELSGSGCDTDLPRETSVPPRSSQLAADLRRPRW